MLIPVLPLYTTSAVYNPTTLGTVNVIVATPSTTGAEYFAPLTVTVTVPSLSTFPLESNTTIGVDTIEFIVFVIFASMNLPNVTLSTTSNTVLATLFVGRGR